MKKKRFLWQIYPAYLLVMLAALTAVTWYGLNTMRAFFLDQIVDDLLSRSYMAEQTIRDLIIADDLALLRRDVIQAGKQARTRITVIKPDGEVLADSEEDPARMDNHADRPEIVSAIAGEVGPAKRFSYTLKKEMMYVAIPILHNSRLIGLLRTSIPTTAIDATLADLYKRIALGGLLAALLVASISWFIANRLAKSLETMRQGAERFALGDFSNKLPEGTSYELTSLAHTLNLMASQLDERIKIITQQHNELEAVFSCMLEGLLTIDSDERVQSINQAAANLLGLDPERVQGKSTLEIVRNIELQRFVKATLAGIEPVEGEISLVDPPDAERHLLVHGVRLRDHTGIHQGALLVLNDVTNMRRLENMRRDFVANVSHELKTPITSIQGFVETLIDGTPHNPEDTRRFLEIVHTQAGRLHAIVEDLLALSRIEQDEDKDKIPLTEHFLVNTLKAARQMCIAHAGEKNITVSLICPETMKACINPTLLEQAVINLIDNAVKYSQAGKEVQIMAGEAEEEVFIKVRDQGVGIALKDQPRIFERFYRVDKGRSKKLGGTGLGLSIVKHIVQAHCGRITLESELRKGSTFTIQLPKNRKP